MTTQTSPPKTAGGALTRSAIGAIGGSSSAANAHDDDDNNACATTNASRLFLRTIQQRIHRAFDVATALREHGFAIIHAVPRQGAQLFRAHDD